MTLTLTNYLLSYLGRLNDEFNYSGDNLSSVVLETLLEYGCETEDQATDKKKLYTLAKKYLWEKVVVDLSATYDFNADGGSYKLGSLYDMALKNLSNANADALAYSSSYQIEVGKLDDQMYDPYSNIPYYYRYEE